MKFFKISFLFLTIIFLNGCFQTSALLGPGITVATTGNVMHAGFQYGANKAIKKETGKDSFEHLQDIIENQKTDEKFLIKFENMVKKKFQITRQKLSLN
jgi:hypothetical protein